MSRGEEILRAVGPLVVPAGKTATVSSRSTRRTRRYGGQMAKPLTGLLAVAIWVVVLAGCGEQQLVKPKAIAFEPTIVGCSGRPSECTLGSAVMLRELREAGNRLCPADKPDVLIKADGVLLCVATLPPAGPTAIGLAIPSAVQAQGHGAVADFKAGEAVAARTGCLACHRIADAGNNGPGSDLTHVGSRLPPAVIARALVDSPAPMPSFSRLLGSARRALVYFLA
jgi:mono/diheme cytochrome c family protein